MKRNITIGLMSLTLLLGQMNLVASASEVQFNQTAEIHSLQAEDYSLKSPAISLPQISFAAEGAVDHGTTWFGLPLNMGPIDRTLRAVLAAGLIGTGIYGLTTNSFSPALNWTLIGVAAIPTVTAASGFCPLYPLFGVEYSF